MCKHLENAVYIGMVWRSKNVTFMCVKANYTIAFWTHSSLNMQMYRPVEIYELVWI